MKQSLGFLNRLSASFDIPAIKMFLVVLTLILFILSAAAPGAGGGVGLSLPNLFGY
jgi:hypothetical protein